jgi:pSer/pThr/pTyr-binding forkhead associated (FHA) protein
VRGASHVRSNAPNQDAVRWRLDPSPGNVLVVAVADGHGSAKSFRSHVGARLAVALATELLWDRIADVPAAPDPRQDADNLRALLPELTERWALEVRAELARRPFGAAELRRLEERASSGGLAELERNPLLAYGATLLAVMVSRTAVHYAQLGDGDILTVWRNGEVQRPLPADRQLIANETTSLCQPDAWRQFRTGSVGLDEAPRLVLLSTDGYANSFASDDEFLQVGSDLLAMIERDGLEAVEGRLEGWLNETSEHGAGDDVSLAIVSLPFSTAQPPPTPPQVRPAPPPPPLNVPAAPPRPMTIPTVPPRLSSTPLVERPATSAPATDGGRPLIVRAGGRNYDVTDLRTVRIGRDPSADIHSGNRLVSGLHALLRSGRTGWVLEDMGSKGGIWHNGRRVERLEIVEPTEIWLGTPGDGDLIELDPGAFPTHRQPAWRRRIVLVAGGALLTLVLALALVVALGGLRPTPPKPTSPPRTTIPAPTTSTPSAPQTSSTIWIHRTGPQ